MAALRKNSAAALNAKWERLFPFRLSNALGNAVADIRWATEIANHSDTLQVGVRQLQVANIGSPLPRWREGTEMHQVFRETMSVVIIFCDSQ